MDLTESYDRVIPEGVLERYDWAETRDAAAVIQNTNPDEFDDLVDVLDEFELLESDIINPGGARSEVPKRIDGGFLDRGWREGEYTQSVTSTLRLKRNPNTGEDAETTEIEVPMGTYLIDNLKGKIAIDVEWHAKDGNLDRDLAAYRYLYEAGAIAAAVVITREFESIRDLANDLGREGAFGTTTTTTINKMIPRLERGDAGGCPVLVAAITQDTLA